MDLHHGCIGRKRLPEVQTSDDYWLRKLPKLNRARGNAPHKPLLLLAVLELGELSELADGPLFLTPILAFRFDTFAQVVAYRRTQRPDVRMPFHHLRTDGFWSAQMESGALSSHHSRRSEDGIRYGMRESGISPGRAPHPDRHTL